MMENSARESLPLDNMPEAEVALRAVISIRVSDE
jgi:hypothetical protein